MNRARRRLTSVIEQISMSERCIPWNRVAGCFDLIIWCSVLARPTCLGVHCFQPLQPYTRYCAGLSTLHVENLHCSHVFHSLPGPLYHDIHAQEKLVHHIIPSKTYRGFLLPDNNSSSSLRLCETQNTCYRGRQAGLATHTELGCCMGQPS